MDGVALTHLLQECCPGSESTHADATRRLCVRTEDDAGGRVWLRVEASASAELIRAIHSISGGIVHVDPSVRTTDRACDPWADQADEASVHEPLLPLEEQVLRLLAASSSNEEMATRTCP